MFTDYTVIVYHAGCPDGATAAVIAKMRYPDARTYPMRAGGKIDDLENEKILMVDVSVKRENLMKLSKCNQCVVIFDHHKTAQDDLESNCLADAMNVHVVFDMERSGAGITWDQLFPDKPRPRIVDYIEDHDLWRFKLPDSEEVRRGLGYVKFYDLEVVKELLDDFDNHFDAIRNAGREIIRYQENVIFPQMAEKAFEATIQGKRAIVVPCAIRALVSEFGSYLVKKHSTHDFVLLWYEMTLSEARKRSCSLRCDENFDVEKIARSYGGGGHKQAAGFVVSGDEFFKLFESTSPKITKSE